MRNALRTIRNLTFVVLLAAGVAAARADVGASSWWDCSQEYGAGICSSCSRPPLRQS